MGNQGRKALISAILKREWGVGRTDINHNILWWVEFLFYAKVNFCCKFML